VRVFVDYFNDLLIFDALKIADGCFEVLFVDVAENDHLKVVLARGELDYIVNTTMILHDTIYQTLI
jgi:hypothetical protein